MAMRTFYTLALAAALVGLPLGAFGQIGGGRGGGVRGGVGGNVGGNVGGGVRAGGNVGGGVRAGANVGGVRAGANVGGVRANVGGGGVRANVGGVRANVGGVRAGVGTDIGAGVRGNVGGVRAGADIDSGVRNNVGVGANVAGRTGVRVGGVGVGIGVGPWWRYGGYHAGVYYPGRWWWNNRWYTYYPWGAGGYGYYGNGYGDYSQTTQVQAAYDGPGVAIRNPSEHPIHFTIDGQRQMSIAAGETIRLTEFADYQIAFDRGENFGSARYTIYEGLYEFTPTERGWELYRQKQDDLTAADERDAAAPRTAERPMRQPPRADEAGERPAELPPPPLPENPRGEY